MRYDYCTPFMRTELIADQPLIVFLHDGQGIAAYLKHELHEREVEIADIRLGTAPFTEQQQEQLDSAYVICWLISPEWFANTSVQEQVDVARALYSHQKKSIMLAPVVSHYTAELAGEFPLITQFCQLQQQMILETNRLLPAARWIFLQDLIAAPRSVHTTIGSLIAQELQLGKVYVPHCQWSVLPFTETLTQVVRLILQPSQLNHVLCGEKMDGSKIASEIQNKYQSMYFSPVATQVVHGETSSPIPFSVTEREVRGDVARSIHEFVTKFPGPRSAILSFSWTRWNESSRATSREIESAEVNPSPTKENQPTIPAILPHNSVREYGNADTPEVLEAKEVVAVSEHTPPEVPNKQISPRATEKTSTFNLSQEVNRVFASTHITTKRSKTATSVKERQTFVKKTRKRTALFYGGLAFTGMGLGILFLIIVFITTLSLFQREVRAGLSDVALLASNDLSGGSLVAPTFSSLKNIVHVQADVYGTVLSLPAIDGALELVALAQTIEDVGSLADRSLQTTQNLVQSILNSQHTNIEALGPNLQADSTLAYEKLEQLLEQIQMAAVLGGDEAETERVTNILKSTHKDWRDNLIISQQMSPVLPQMLAADRQRTYALLFQNNQELRPTGGFIEAVALVTLSQDGLVGYEVLSSYQINRRVPGAVKAPEEIKRYLGEEQLNFHDSNWDPHFPTTAEQVVWFLSKSLEKDIDGVLTIDVDGLAVLLEQLGPLELPQYNEVVTHRTLAERVEFHSEVILVADEDKKDYRQVLFEGVLEKIRTTPREKSLGLLRALRTNFEQQNMLFVPIRAEELQALTVLGWTGAVLSPSCPSQLSQVPCHIETIAQFEANVGVNKANFYLEREIEHVVVPLGNELYHERMITYTNTAQSNSWPKGPYKAYVRLYMPQTAQLKSVKVGSTTLEGMEYVQTQSQQKNVVGFLVEVPTRSSVPVVISFTTPFDHETEEEYSYALFEQYQPGSGTNTYRFRFTPPSNYSPTLIAPQPDVRGDDLLFVRDMRAHSLFGVQLSRLENNW